MIREGTEKGFHLGIRGAAAALALLAAGLVRAGPGPAPAWWEVRLTVTLKGEYSVKCRDAPVSGEYAGRIRWEGRLEPDADDFLLVHIRTEVLEWSLRERSGQDGTASVLDAPRSSSPVLHLNYVLREAGEVGFYFEVEGTSVPIHERPLKIPLAMPRSAGLGGATPGYPDFILSGSNRIVIPAADLGRARPERSFAWTWHRVERFDVSALTYVAIQSHSAEAVVALVRH
jgi:hypothetical protein